MLAKAGAGARFLVWTAILSSSARAGVVSASSSSHWGLVAVGAEEIARRVRGKLTQPLQPTAPEVAVAG